MTEHDLTRPAAEAWPSAPPAPPPSDAPSDAPPQEPAPEHAPASWDDAPDPVLADYTRRLEALAPVAAIPSGGAALRALEGRHGGQVAGFVRRSGGRAAAERNAAAGLRAMHHLMSGMSPRLRAEFARLDDAVGFTVDPGFMLALGEMGLALAERDNARDGGRDAISVTAPAAPTAPENSGDRPDLERRARDLGRAKHAALLRFDSEEAARLDAEQGAVYRALYGGQPIVGQGGRRA